MLPFRSVTSTDNPITHLVVISPAVAGSTPSALPPLALCGRRVGEESLDEPGDVQCKGCLFEAPRFMHLPAYESCR